jgi:acyl-CoA reductase-like NAD-dependent aldehyde dehydrogenase
MAADAADVVSPETLDITVPGLDHLMIAGEWVTPATANTIDVVMPSTEQVIATVPAPSQADADAAIAAAREAYDNGPWSLLPIEERVAVCRRFADELEARFDDMSRAWIFESGYPKPYGDIINRAGKTIWDHVLDLAPGLPWEERRRSGHSEVVLRREPVGVVLAILTSNGPVSLTGLKVIPGLLAGCPVIMKYAPDSQLVGRFIADAARAAEFPPGVVTLLCAGLETTQYMVEHEGVDMVHMTGSIIGATDVLARSAAKFGRTAFELGGKSPAVLLEDADLDDVMPTLVPGGIGGTGQVCVALTRVLVPRARYDEVVERMAAEFAQVRIGDPFDPETHWGPLSTERALARNQAMVDRAVEQGARVVVGGGRPPGLDRGYYFAPTLLADVDETMEIAQQEVFGPVVVVMPYDTVDEAVRIANSTVYGLAASVYSADVVAATKVAERIRSGSVGINVSGVCLTEPFGGVKKSGRGREGGAEGIWEFTEIKQLLLSGSFTDS